MGYTPAIVIMGDLENEGDITKQINWSILPQDLEKTLKYSRAAEYFEEALPLGNGQLGAMVYGRRDVEKISINHDTLWSGKPGDNFVDGAFESNERAKALLKEAFKRLDRYVFNA